MSEMGGMSMPGEWTMSMTWMRTPDQSWLTAATSFVAMWTAMMVAMMLPSLLPALGRYRAALTGHARPRAGRLTTLVALGYFSAWIAVGVAIYPLGVVVEAALVRLPELASTASLAAGVVVCLAGVLQLSPWKSRHLVSWRNAGPRITSAAPGGAWRRGVRLGITCVFGCAPLTATLLVVGVMDLRAMVAVTVAVTAERLAPRDLPVTRLIGVVALVLGSLMILHGRALL